MAFVKWRGHTVCPAHADILCKIENTSIGSSPLIHEIAGIFADYVSLSARYDLTDIMLTKYIEGSIEVSLDETATLDFVESTEQKLHDIQLTLQRLERKT